jgi:outer membrane protein, heavy metal efflux system
MRRVSWASSMLMALAVSTAANAQTLTQDQFLADVLASHPGVVAAEAAVTAAAGVRRQAGVVDNPVLSWEREDPEMAPRQDTWRVDWRLPFDGRRHRVAAGTASLAASSSELEAARLGIRIEMRSVFASWYLATEREVVLAAQLERTRKLAEWLRARADQGEAAGVEARRLELELEVLEREAVAASAATRSARADAASWSGLVTDEVRPVRPFLPPPPSTVEVSGRPDLVALSHRVAELEARYRLSRRLLEPPELSVGWMELRDGQQRYEGPVIGLAWPVPLFDRNQGNREAGKAGVDRAQAEWEAARRRAAAHAQAALAAYSDLYRVSGSERRDGLDSEVAGSVFAAFEAGEASLTDVLDTLRTTVGVQLSRLDTYSLALEAERQLEAALGRPILPGGSS